MADTRVCSFMYETCLGMKFYDSIAAVQWFPEHQNVCWTT